MISCNLDCLASITEIAISAEPNLSLYSPFTSVSYNNFGSFHLTLYLNFFDVKPNFQKAYAISLAKYVDVPSDRINILSVSCS